MWIAIFGVCLLFAVGAVIYLTAGFHRFSLIKRLGEKHRLLSWGIAFALTAGVAALSCLINVWSAVVILIHLFIFWVIADLIGLIIAKIRRKKPVKNYTGAAAIAFTCVYMGIGWYFAHHVVRTDYALTMQKDVNGLKIAMFADSHLGITLDGERFAEQMERIKAEEPDILLIPGDFVDDDSCKADMVRACAALGEIKPKYGIYFTFGNHDRGYGNYRDFTTDDLMAELDKNGVTVLQDEVTDIGDGIRLIGRRDTYEEGRTAMAKLSVGKSSSYTIVMDHQPNDYDAEAAAGVDLVLSGHTHGGHLFPAGYIGLLIGANDAVYGHERRGNTDFLVTSGISGWALPFKTGTVAEYVVIEVNNS